MKIKNYKKHAEISFDEILSITSVEKDCKEMIGFLQNGNDIKEVSINFENINKIDTSYFQLLLSFIASIKEKEYKILNKSEMYLSFEKLYGIIL